MNWARGYMEALQNAERATLSRNRVTEEASDAVLVQGPSRGGGGTHIDLYVVGVSLNSNNKLSVKYRDGDGNPTGEAFDLAVQSFGETAAENGQVDLRAVIPNVVQGLRAIAAVVGNQMWCVSPQFHKIGCEK